MNDRKLTQSDFERGPARERISHLQHVADLSEHSRIRVDEAMRAAVAHVEKEKGLTQGMRSKDVDTALNFLDTHYEGRHDLRPQEREVIEKSFKSHFHINDAAPEAANDDEYRKAA